MSEIKVNKVSPSTGTNLTLGDSGDTVIIPAGATINNQGTATGFPQTVLTFPTVTLMVVTGGSATTVSPNTSTACTITGTNFVSGATVNLINTTGAIVTPEATGFTNSTTLTAKVNLPEGAYFVRVENPNGFSGRSSATLLTSSGTPTWTTSAGSLGTFAGGTTGNITTIVATSSDASPALTMTEVSGTGLTGSGNANCQLTVSTTGVTTTGTIASSGGLGGSASSTQTYSFTIRATDGTPQSTDRTFTITTSYGATGSTQFN